MLRLIALLFALCIATPALADPLPATVAVAFDRSGVHPLFAEGAADRASGRMATADSPVRIASISKLVTTLGVMRLVDRHKLDLDRDVSDYLGWKLRNPAFPDKAITLRMLLSHTSSLVDGGELYLIPLGTTLRERLADPRVWDSVHAPGSGWFQYTNLNFPVAASVMEAATGERFDRLMRREVLEPLGLDACYNWSGCTPAYAARAVVLYRATGEVAKDDLHGELPGCLVQAGADGACDLSTYTPGWNGALFSPQGGLRISMRDLAKIGRMLANHAKGFLTPESFAAMTAPQWQLGGAASGGINEGGDADGYFCAYGLAVHSIGGRQPGCHDDLFGDGRARFGHSGDAYGLHSGLWIDPATGSGLAFFTTAVAPDAPKGRHSAFTLAEEQVVERSLH